MKPANRETGPATIPEQAPVSWAVAAAVSWAGLRRRLLRALITMLGVILAIAFLSYMLLTDAVTRALIAADDSALNILLQKASVDIFADGGTDRMMILLIGLSCLTCLVGIVNSMLMSVTERVREIGTLKCLGARDLFVLKMFLIESALQGVFGALVGAGLGTLVAFGAAVVNYRGYAFTHLPVGALLEALLVSFLVGTLLSIVASIAPAYMAARKQPVEALRVEE